MKTTEKSCLHDGQEIHGRIPRPLFLDRHRKFRQGTHQLVWTSKSWWACKRAREIFPYKKRVLLVHPCVRAITNFSSIEAVHYRFTLDRLQKMVKHEHVKEEDDKILKKDWCEDVQLFGKSAKNGSFFLKMLSNFQSMSDRHLRRTSFANHHNAIVSDKKRQVHSAPYQPRTTVRPSSATKISRLIANKVVELTKTK